MKRIKLSQFIGRQLSRMKIAMAYVILFTSTITAIGVLNIAFPEIETWIIVMLFPVVIIGSIFLGYILDESNVTTMDYNKSIEMTQRYLTRLDFKNNEFLISLMEVFEKWFNDLKENKPNKPVDPDILKEKYDEFVKKYSPKEK